MPDTTTPTPTPAPAAAPTPSPTPSSSPSPSPSSAPSGMADLLSDWDVKMEAATSGNDPYAKPEGTSEEKSEEEPEEASEEKSEEKPKEKDHTDFPTPKNLTEKATAKWGELRSKADKTDKLEAEAVELRRQLDEVRKAPPAEQTAEVETLKKRVEAQEAVLAVSNVEATEEFQNNVVAPMVNVVNFLKELSEAYADQGVTYNELIGALSQVDARAQTNALTEIASSLSERDRLKLYGAADDYTELLRRRNVYHATAKDHSTKLAADKATEETRTKVESDAKATKYSADYESARAKVYNDLKAKVPVLADKDVATDVERLTKGDYSNADPELKSYLAHAGALLPHLLKALKDAGGNLEKANKTIAGYRNGSPKAGSGTSEQSRQIGAEADFLSSIEQQLR